MWYKRQKEKKSQIRRCLTQTSRDNETMMDEGLEVVDNQLNRVAKSCVMGEVNKSIIVISASC